MEAAIDKRILLRMRKELKDLETSPPLGVVCYPLNDNIVHLQAEISGPEDTPYSTGTFKIDILIPDSSKPEYTIPTLTSKAGYASTFLKAPPRDHGDLRSANEFKENRDLFMLKAKQYTERYATGYEDNPGGEDGVEACLPNGKLFIQH
ncbi:Ubiquitin-conjugating enzyme E2 T [Mortierella antarctica]|nr:Ubiquitin-conjugating enzyme E2 T [Mortierella antarctica]